MKDSLRGSLITVEYNCHWILGVQTGYSLPAGISARKGYTFLSLGWDRLRAGGLSAWLHSGGFCSSDLQSTTLVTPSPASGGMFLGTTVVPMRITPGLVKSGMILSLRRNGVPKITS